MLGDLAPFGATGLIAWMWLVERRSSAERERQLTEAHERLVQEKLELDTLVGLVRENTRAVSSLETSQRHLANLLRVLVRVPMGRGGGPPGPGRR